MVQNISGLIPVAAAARNRKRASHCTEWTFVPDLHRRRTYPVLRAAVSGITISLIAFFRKKWRL
jgi:hypothetical protein